VKRLSAGAAEVVQRAAVRQIRLTRSRCESQVRTSAEIPSDATLSVTSGGRVSQPLDSEGTFGVEAKVEVVASSESANKPRLVGIEAAYEVLYRLPEGLKPSAEALEEFAQTNGIFNAWPYLRQFVAETAQRMEVPPIVLPLYRRAAAGAEKKRRPGSAKKAKR
jgi:hypothetical protein